MIGESHLQQIRHRIDDLRNQRSHAEGRLAKTLDGMIQTEQSRLIQWQRLVEIQSFDGE